jgi:hypothetical protein
MLYLTEALRSPIPCNDGFLKQALIPCMEIIPIAEEDIEAMEMYLSEYMT